MTGKKPLTAIILVNYNGWKDTLECLESVRRNDYPNYRIFVCDNASKDDSASQLKKWADKNRTAKNGKMTLILNKENLGFAGGNNTAVKKALKDGAEYILLLNNDTTVEEDFLSRLVEAAESDNRFGAVGGKIYYYGNKKKIWAAGGGFINPLTGVSRHFGLNQADGPENSRMMELDYLTGCLMLVRKSAVQKTGLMDEKYFLYYEESDWQYRMRQAGFRILYVPESKIYHKVSASTGRGSPEMKYYFIRNRIYFIKKNFNLFFKVIALTWTVCAAIARAVFHRITGHGEKSAILMRAIRDGWNNRMGAYRP